MNILIYMFLIFIISFSCQVFLIYICGKFRIFDHPGERKVHTTPIPRIGGVGIYLSFLVFFVFSDFYKDKNLLYIFSGATAVFIFNLIDDLKRNGINNKFKLGFQIIISIALYYSGVKVSLFLNNEFLRLVLTVFWVTGVMNAFNLIDNMNGLSSGISMISSLFFAIIFYQEGNFPLFYCCIFLFSSLTGFYILNFPKARIFMGDCGAYFIGFLLASFSIYGSYVMETRLTRLPVIAPLLVLSVPIYDTVSVMIIRKIKGYSIFRADTNHISHRLSYMGLSHTKSVLVIYLIAIISGMGALMLRDMYLSSALIMIVQLFIFYILITILVYAGKKN